MHVFREPADICSATGNDPLLLDLINTDAFKRLKDVRFLGAIDYCRIPRPNGKRGVTRFSRYQHSLGVMQLALQYCSAKNLPPSTRRLICAAALLHDIGHSPLSHSIEAVFQDILGLNHHTAAENIICARVSLGKDVYSILTRYSVDVERLIFLISGKTKAFDGFFGGPINFDTIEGILRCHNYRRIIPGTSNPAVVTKAAIARIDNDDRALVDDFWKLKNFVYKNIINTKDGVLSDLACDLFLRENAGRLTSEIYYGTESTLFEVFPGLKELLTSGAFASYAMDVARKPIYFTDRAYSINDNADFFLREDSTRYQQTRVRRMLDIHPKMDMPDEDAASNSKGVLFRDDTL